MPPKYVLNMDALLGKTPKSPRRFNGDYKKFLQALVDRLDATLESRVSWDRFTIDSVMSARNNVRLRVRDHELGEPMIANCEFWYGKDDVVYGRVNLDLVISWFGKAAEKRFLGTFDITDGDAVEERVLRGLEKFVRFQGS